MADQARLPLGINSFEKIRSTNMIYVDKTDLIFELASLNDPFFLSRPRRFGKSLLLSTFESLFTHGTEYFKGLKIEKRWNELEKGRTYKAIHLDFSTLSCSSVSEFDLELSKNLRKYAKKNQLNLDCADADDRAGAILKLLVENHPSELILLIDEYDYPLTHALGDENLFEDFRTYLQSLFGAVKAICGDLRFFFMTGVGRFARTSVFSQLNNLNDITLTGKYTTLLGYTDEEVHQYFADYVQETAQKLKLTDKQLYSELKTYYDGYRMTVASDRTVYSPWSVLNFFRKQEGFKNYWYESGGFYPTLVAKYIQSIQDTPFETLQKVKISETDLSTFYDYFEVPTVALLYQTGYLTVRTEENDLGGESLYLCPPNLEVSSALMKLYFMKVNRQAPSEGTLSEISSALRNNLRDQNYERLIKTFNAVLNTCGYDDREAFADEHYIRDLLYLVFVITGLDAKREEISARGRADLVVEMPDRRYVFEFKLARDTEPVEKLLTEAVTQLEDRRYGEPEKPLIRMAVVISARDKAVAEWKLV